MPGMAHLKSYVTIGQAAEIMGLHAAYVRKLCRDGKVPHDRVGNMILVSRRAAEGFQRDPLGRGRPKRTKRPKRS